MCYLGHREDVVVKAKALIVSWRSAVSLIMRMSLSVLENLKYPIPCNTVLLEKLTVTQVFKNYPP
jgi:hypothetical protein